MTKTRSSLNLVCPPPEVLPLSDGELTTEDGASFPVFKIKLVEGSDYFLRLFCGAAGAGRRTYAIPGVRGDVLQLVLSFLYSGTVDVTDSNAGDLLVAADYLLVDGLTQRILDGYFGKRLDASNCVSFLASALQTSHQDVVRECFRFIQLRFEEVVAADWSGAVARLPLPVLEQFLRSGSLCVRDETPVWEFIRRWVEGDPEDRLRHLPTLLRHLAVWDISGDLADRIISSPIVAGNPACAELRAVVERLGYQGGSFVLRHYQLKQSGPESAAFSTRRPPRVHFAAFRLQADNRSSRYALHVTFDEQLDLWRRVAVARTRPEFAFALGHSLYLFNKSRPFLYRFSLVEGKWHCCLPPSADDWFLAAAHFDGKLFAVFPNRRAKIYSPRRERWTKVKSMRVSVLLPVAATVGRQVYVVGLDPRGNFVAQVYCTEAACWRVVQPPSLCHAPFDLVAHREKLYLFGEQQVEVYDPGLQEWSVREPLPQKIRHPQATVLNGRIIVCSELDLYLQPGPAFVRDDGSGRWSPVDESCDIRRFRVFSALDRDCVNLVTKQNRNPRCQFTKSPIERHG